MPPVVIGYKGTGQTSPGQDVWPPEIFGLLGDGYDINVVVTGSGTLGTILRSNEVELAPLLIARGLEEIERRVCANELPRDPEQGYVEVFYTTEQGDDLVASLDRAKVCRWQESGHQGLECAATPPGEERATTTALCTACAMPDARIVCSQLTHPKNIPIRTMSTFERLPGPALCNLGHNAGDGSECLPGGKPCWQRVVDAPSTSSAPAHAGSLSFDASVSASAAESSAEAEPHPAGPRVFISYQYADKELAHSLEVELRARGAETWIDSKNLRLGDSMIERISQAIAEGYFLVALVSPASVKSEWCRTELGYAMSKAISDRRVAVLPLRVNEAEMPPILTGRKWEELGTANVAAVAGLIVADARKHLEEVVGISPSLRADGASIPIAPGPAARRSTPASAEPVPAALQRALLLSLIQPSYYNAIVNGADRALVARVMLAASTPAGALAMLGTSEKNAFEDAVANSRFESLLLDLTSVLKRSGSDHFWRKVDPTTSSLVTVSRPAAKKTHVDGWMVEGRAALSLRPGQAYAQPTWHEVHLDVAIRPSDPARPTGGDEFTPLGLGNLFSLLHAPLSALLDEIAPNVIPLITRTSDYEILAVSGVLLPNGDTFDRYVDLGFFSAARAEGAHGPWGLQWSAATLDQIRTPEARTVMLRAEIERLFSDAGYEDYEQDVRQLAPTRLNPPPKT